MQSLTGEQAAAGQQELAGKAALIASVGGQRGYADWTNPDHRLRRLLSEFIGMAGLTFVLSGGAAILARGSLLSLQGLHVRTQPGRRGPRGPRGQRGCRRSRGGAG